jgi:tRNA G18 (ribose-2'-O)-methylase SpoU
MALVRIESLDDPRLAPYRSLKRTNDTRWTGRFVVEGDKLVRRLLRSDFAIESLLLGQREVDSLAQLAVGDQNVLVVPDDWIERIVGFNFHRGVLACALRKPAVDLAAFCRDRPGALTLVVCPDVQNPENLGALIRIAHALGVSAMVLGPRCCDPLSRRVLRVSMGSALKLPLIQADDLETKLADVRASWGVHSWATVADAGGVPFERLERPSRLALLFGSEGHGLEDRWLRLCEERITIPMQPGVDSLNVSVAAGILLYHLTRQAN